MSRPVKGTLYKRGRIYWCKFTHQNRLCRFSLKTTKESHACHERDRLMAMRLGAMAEGTFHSKFGNEDVTSPKDNGKMLITSAWKAFDASQCRPDSGASTLRQYALQFNRFVEWLGKQHPNLRYLSDVDSSVAEQFAQHLSGRVCGGTFNKYIRLLLLVFRILSKAAGIVENPWCNITRRKHTPISKRDLTDKELKAIFIAAKGEMFTICLEAYHTALRLGDDCLLEWTEVNFATGRITRIPLKTARRNPKPVIIPMHSELASHLRSIAGERKDKYVCPEMAAAYKRDPASVTDMFQEFLKACGIRSQLEGTGKGTGKRAVVEVGFHSFRHTWVTRAKERGMDSASIQAIVGWGSPAMEKVYTHVGIERLEQGIRGQTPVTGLAAQPPAVANMEAMPDEQLRQMSAALQVELRRRKGKASGNET